MDTHEAQQLCEQAIAEHCPTFSFAWLDTKTIAGKCHFKDQDAPDTIYLSLPFVQYNEECHVRDTIFHEVAHAKCGPNHEAHGKVWQRMAVSLGAEPKARTSSLTRPPGRYQVVCDKCGTVHQRERLPRARVELECYQKVNGRRCHGSLTWFENGVKVEL